MFLLESGWRVIYICIMFFNSFVAILLNSVLIYLVIRVNSSAMNSYKPILYGFGIFGIMTSTAGACACQFFLLVERNVVSVYLSPFLTVIPAAVPVVKIVWIQSFAMEKSFMCISFVVRYFQICRTPSKRVINIPCIIICCVIVICESLVYSYLTYILIINPEQESYFRNRLLVVLSGQIDSPMPIGFISEDKNLEHPVIYGFTGFFIATCLLLTIIVTCAFKILKYINTASQLSVTTQKIYRDMVLLLGAQTVSPTIFLMVPGLFYFGKAVFAIDIPIEIQYLLSICLSLFPVFNPILIIYGSNDLRSQLLRKMKNNSKTKLSNNGKVRDEGTLVCEDYVAEHPGRRGFYPNGIRTIDPSLLPKGSTNQLIFKKKQDYKPRERAVARKYFAGGSLLAYLMFNPKI